MRKSIPEIFREKIKKLIEDKREGFIRTCKREVFFQMLNQFTEYLPLTVVASGSEDCFDLMHYIGIFMEKERFYYKKERNSLYTAVEFDRHPYRVERTNEIDEIWKVLIILDELNGDGCFDNKYKEEILMPNGYYLFRYKACFISSWSAGVVQEFMSVKKADCIEDAIKKFKHEFCSGLANCFMDFEIFVNDKWRKLINAAGAILYDLNFYDPEFILEEE